VRRGNEPSTYCRPSLDKEPTPWYNPPESRADCRRRASP
jgi:hypothetical protein